MKFAIIPPIAVNAFARTLLLAALSGVTLNATSPSRGRPANRGGVPATTSPTAPVPTQLPRCFLLDGKVNCPPPIPINAPLDTNSDQTVYGLKNFNQPIGGDITGNAATADNFTGVLVGDIAGTQQDNHVVNVPVSALPAIGFGLTPSAAKIKYVDSDADGNDPRMDGSLAHPYQNLSAAAANVHDGDRLILHGNLWGYAVFSQAVTLEGASAYQTTVYGSLVFNGFHASTVRNLRVNCTSDTACISNLTTGGADLILERVIATQSYTGPAVSAINGAVAAYSSQFSAVNGAAVEVSNADGNLNRFTDCDFTSGRGAALFIEGATKTEITGSRLTASGAGSALLISEATSVRVLQSHLAAAGNVVYGKNSYSVLISGSWLTSGGGDEVVKFDNAPRLTFAIPTDHRILVDNYFRTGGASAIGCVQADEIFSRGNIMMDQATGIGPASGVKTFGSRIPIILPPPPIQPACTLLSLASF